MNKVSFEYRAVCNPKNCLFKATSRETGDIWSVEIPLPYPFGSDFWEQDQYSRSVLNKSKKLAKLHKAPAWVYS